MKRQYYIREVTPAIAKEQIWLEAYPRFQQDRANFHHAQFLITAEKMEPYALRIVQPNKQDYTVYQFWSIVVNDPFRLFKGDPFRAFAPVGWQRIVEESPSVQARRPPSNSQQ